LLQVDALQQEASKLHEALDSARDGSEVRSLRSALAAAEARSADADGVRAEMAEVYGRLSASVQEVCKLCGVPDTH
jgi:hypothetical protein